MLGPIQVWIEPDGTFTASRGCTRIMDSLWAFHPGTRSHGVNFPGKMVRAESRQELDKILRRGVVWA